jgi:hypothetical protein
LLPGSSDALGTSGGFGLEQEETCSLPGGLPRFLPPFLVFIQGDCSEWRVNKCKSFMVCLFPVKEHVSLFAKAKQMRPNGVVCWSGIFYLSRVLCCFLFGGAEMADSISFSDMLSPFVTSFKVEAV